MWMAYQPIVSWSGRKALAYEALVRTNSAALTNPGEMFDAAEKLARVHELGRAIRARVAEDASLLDPRALVFVNLHPLDLVDDQLFATDSPLSRIAERVVLEVTERAPLDHMADLRKRVQVLTSLGFRLAIDDLGAGYSNLSTFTYLEPQFVKLDMALTRNIDSSPTKQKLVSSMLSLCNELGIMTVAEGIETVAERNAVTNIGCNLMQGYLFAKPSRPETCGPRF
jgi:EAL domain-containing protein (putative c-di-GMP-specific phosphodiesterase class I)